TGLVYCNALFCEPEQFQHDYIVRNHDQTPHSNKWKRARIGESATLHDVCLLRNGLPVTRKCLLQGMHAQWEPIDNWRRVVCMRRFREHSVSVDLNTLHDDILEGRRLTNNTQGRRNTSALMRSIFQRHNRTVLPADVHMTGQVFSELMEQPKDEVVSTDLVSVCREIMSSDARVLRLSAQLNATNALLSNFESYMDALPQQFVASERCGKAVVHAASEGTAAETGVSIANFANIGVQVLMSGNLSVFYVNPMCENITGIAVYSAAAPDRREGSGFWYRFLYANVSVEELKWESKLETAVFTPEQLWHQLLARGASYLVLKVYGHDALFVETAMQRSRRPRSKVLSISIPGFEGKQIEAVLLVIRLIMPLLPSLSGEQLPQTLPFLLRNENQLQPDIRANRSGSGCGYWNYETWLSDGVMTSSGTDMLRDPIIVCQTRHLTQFSFLVGGSYRINDQGDEVLVTPLNERVLDIISIVGCSLSLFGVLGIFVTAAVFKSFRSQASTKVLLHLCLAMTLQMVLFVFINTDDLSEALISHGATTRCVLLGASLQYSILVLFSWMLIIAFLQFQRYVTVIGIERPRHYILKAAIVAWSLPLLPTLLVACIDPGSYLPTEAQLATDTAICYPSGYGLTFGVVLPVTLITVSNLVIFVYVFYSISHSLSQSVHRAERKMIYKQIRLSILLFFLLGLTWIFGIFAFMQAGVAFSYLFCLTATMQGFVLFIYFVVLDEANRRAWLGLIWPTEMKMNVQKRMTELQSMTTSSTNYSGGRSE
ncbi:hypothetical protein KR222_011321, partial [Zaprionus bogoriensis]